MIIKKLIGGKKKMDIKKLILIGILLIILLALVGFILGSITHTPENVKNVTTPYNTHCQLDIGEGIITEDTVVNDDGQKLAFTDGISECLFISTNQDVSDLTRNIEASGTKCLDDGVVWYHMKDQQLTNSYSVFGGTHLKLGDVNEYNVGFIENPNGGETIILVAPPDTIVDCFNSIQWGP